MEQTRLFGDEELPEGFVFKPEFLTVEEERGLLGVIQGLPFAEFQMHGVVAKRRIVQFGVHYSFGSHKLRPAPACPDAFEPIRVRAAELAGVQADTFAESLVTEYQPGAGIGWHRDAPPFGIVAGISLGGRCRMRFQKGTGADRQTAAVELTPRSIYLLTGSARSEWQHTIPAATELRYSITFRTLRERTSGK